MMTLVLIWLTLSVVIGACVCRLLTLAGPGNPEKVIYTGYLGKLFRGSAVGVWQLGDIDRDPPRVIPR
jgi:hypothetical protein